MAKQALTYSIIESASFTNIFETLDDRDNISDPKDPSGSGNRDFILDYDPFHKAINFAGFPYIIVGYPVISYSNNSTDGKRKKIGFTQTLTIRTAREGSSGAGKIDLGRTEMLEITDDLQQLFNVLSNRQTLKNLKLQKFNLDKISTDTLSIEDKYAYEAVYELNYETPWLDVNS